MMVSNDTIEFLKIRIQTNPHSYLFARLADHLLAVGHVDQAIEVCERGIKTHPYYVSGHFIMGKCYFRKRMYDHAEKEFKRVLFFDPKYLSAHKYYAETMEHLGWDTAIETAYQKILEIDPFDDDIRKKYQSVLAQKQQEKQATQSEPVFDTWEREIPTSVPATPEVPPLRPQNPENKSGDDTVERLKPKISGTDWEEKPESSPKPHVAEEDVNDQIFEAVIEEEPPSAEDAEKFSYILDDIFREEAVVDSAENGEAEFSFFDNFDEEVNERPAPPIENPTGMREEEVAEMVFGVSDSDSDPLEELSQIEQEMHEETEKNIPAADLPEAPEVRLKATELPDEPVSQAPAHVNEKTPQNVSTPQPAVDEAEIASIEDLARDIAQQATPRPITKPEPESEPEVIQEKSMSRVREPETGDVKRKKEKIVTPTLGEIYAAQAQYAKAIGVFELLRKKEPTNTAYVEKIKYLKKKLEESMNK